MQPTPSYPIGTPGQPWGDAERDQWRARQLRQRSHADDVLRAIDALRSQWDVLPYGEVAYANAHHAPEHFPLQALRSRHWQPGLPSVLVTGGVHGYETSGVHGALRFAQQHAAEFAGRANLLVVPCISPWAYERFQRWNFDAIDPNRSFKEGSPAQESAALMRLVAQHQAQYGPFDAHIDLHETTDTDESEYRPAVAARDGKVFEPGSIPDGFYLVDDTENPQPAFQQAIIDAVGRVTHIAPADDKNEIIGSPVVAPGVIRYQLKAWGLCASVSGARYTTTTEVYPDSPRATPEQCIAAQVAAVCAAVEFVCGAG
ncbi:M14 family metallopeptidase [Acidovorax kalamii]|uniref:M14 family metallopeptidase n=1 Tax=Acidovorax kalamii TaxID=2004485 RepID=UPI002090DF95|nr:M14 family metallocarboxypeptidase [Acidovorax kalamii]MCO5358342.1 M14 family metallocarboxypeptidase [Acidovorax kalamii]